MIFERARKGEMITFEKKIKERKSFHMVYLMIFEKARKGEGMTRRQG